MATSTADLRIAIAAVNNSSAELRRVTKDLNSLDKAAGRTPGLANLNKQLGLSKAVFAGVFTAGALSQAPALLSSMARAAADDAASIERLKQAVENTGASWSKYQGTLDKTVKTAQKMGFADSQSRDALALLTAQTEDAGEAQRRFNLAMDLSRGANIDLVTASKLLGKVTDENVNVLARYGIAVEKGATSTELFAAVQRKFSGQAEAFSNSAAGQLARTRIAAEEAGEAVGRLLLPAAEDLAKTLAVIATQGENAADGLGGVTDAVDVFPTLAVGAVGFGTALAAINLAGFAKDALGGVTNIRNLGAVLKTTRGQALLFAGSLVAVDIASQALTGKGIIQNLKDAFSTADEKAAGAAKSVEKFNEEMERIRTGAPLFRQDALAAQELGESIRDTVIDLKAAREEAAKVEPLARNTKGILELEGSLAGLTDELERFAQNAHDPVAALRAVRDELTETDSETLQVRGAITSLIVEYDELGGSVDKVTRELIAAAGASGKTLTELQRIAGAAPEAALGVTDLDQALNALDDTFGKINDAFNRPTIEQLTLQAQIAEIDELIAGYEEAGKAVPEEISRMRDQLGLYDARLTATRRSTIADLELITAQFLEAFGPERQEDVDKLIEQIAGMPEGKQVLIRTILDEGGVMAVEGYLKALEQRQVVVDVVTQITEAVTRKKVGSQFSPAEKSYINSVARGKGEQEPYPGFATGIRGFTGGLAMVHQDELLRLPRGTDVLNRSETRQAFRDAEPRGESDAGPNIAYITMNNYGDVSESQTRRIENSLMRRLKDEFDMETVSGQRLPIGVYTSR